MLRQAKDLGVLLQSKASLVVLETWQEDHAITLLQRESRRLNRTLYRWSLTEGLSTCGFGPRIDDGGKALEPEELLEAIKSRNEGGIFALCDFHLFKNAPKIVRLVKDIALGAQHSHKTLVFISHQLQLPVELSRFSVSAN